MVLITIVTRTSYWGFYLVTNVHITGRGPSHCDHGSWSSLGGKCASGASKLLFPFFGFSRSQLPHFSDFPASHVWLSHYIYIYIYIYIYLYIWLVLDLPHWKMMDFVRLDHHDHHPNYWRSHQNHVPNHQPVIYPFIDCPYAKHSDIVLEYAHQYLPLSKITQCSR